MVMVTVRVRVRVGVLVCRRPGTLGQGHWVRGRVMVRVRVGVVVGVEVRETSSMHSTPYKTYIP